MDMLVLLDTLSIFEFLQCPFILHSHAPSTSVLVHTLWRHSPPVTLEPVGPLSHSHRWNGNLGSGND